jgi:hypothetical protein
VSGADLEELDPEGAVRGVYQMAPCDDGIEGAFQIECVEVGQNGLGAMHVFEGFR